MSTSPREATQHPRFGATPARILIVDDSVVARAVIGRLIDNGERFTVAGAVSDARAALAFLVDNRVDMVLLDIELPGIDGLSALPDIIAAGNRSEEHTSELQSLMRISYAVFCLKKKKKSKKLRNH